jgi:cyanophycinase
VRTFLIGGGRDSTAAHEPFIRAAGGPVVAFALDTGDDSVVDGWADTLGTLGVPTTRIVAVSPSRPPRAADLDGAVGVYVAGGLTPAYRDVLVDSGTGWLAAAGAADLVYAGFSAGAAIAGVRALVGGWRTVYRGRGIEVCNEECAEDLDPLTVLPGLGLVPFLVEVHAAQWGTLHRLVYALDAAGVDDGFALDEGTALEVDSGVATVHGTGAATRVRRVDGGVRLTVHLAGDTVAVPDR